MSDKAKETMLLWLLNGVWAIALVLMGTLGTIIFAAQGALDVRVDAMPEKFVLKADYREDHHALINALHIIAKQIDAKAQGIEDDYNRRMDKMEDNITRLISNGNK